MIWKPELTVAAVVEERGRFLIVEERAARRRVFNQPAGHVEEGEDFVRAVVRETLEETAWQFEPQAIVGVYLWKNPTNQKTFLRVAYSGTVSSQDVSRPLDVGILRVHWLTRDQLLGNEARLRSPMVLRCVDDYLAGVRFPLGLLSQLPPEQVAARAAVL
ncbi:MAG TPA: NUDIX hydrolase [Steroidobacteraceae bacterium]|nr:NUDIX hydrolase [Steroidobacteraceae bacterium]